MKTTVPKPTDIRKMVERHRTIPLESAISFIGGNAGATREESFERRQRRAVGEPEALLD
jgi:hypothetical protein